MWCHNWSIVICTSCKMLMFLFGWPKTMKLFSNSWNNRFLRVSFVGTKWWSRNGFHVLYSPHSLASYVLSPCKPWKASWRNRCSVSMLLSCTPSSCQKPFIQSSSLRCRASILLKSSSAKSFLHRHHYSPRTYKSQIVERGRRSSKEAIKLF